MSIQENNNIEAKSNFLRLTVLKDEIEFFHKTLLKPNTFLDQLRYIKQNFTTLNTLRESISQFDNYIKDSKELSLKTKTLRKRLEFVNHLRNKIGGHLDDELLKRAAQWEPHIFSETISEYKDFQLLLVYKTIIESSINSYVDESDNDNQKFFKTEIDLNYPPDRNLFFNFLGNLNIDVINWISQMITSVELDFKYSNIVETFKFCKIAGATDFNLKKDQKLKNDYSLDDESWKMIEEIYYEVNHSNKTEKIQEIIKKLIDKDRKKQK